MANAKKKWMSGNFPKVRIRIKKSRQNQPFPEKISVQLNSGKIVLDSIGTMQRVKGKLHWANGVVALDKFKAQFFNGEISAKGTLWPKNEVLVQGKKISLEQLAQENKLDFASLKGKMKFKFRLQENTGTGSFLGTNVEVCDLNLENIFIRQLFRAEIPCLVFDSISSQIIMEGHFLTFPDLAGSGKQADFTGRGRILQDGNIHFQIQTQVAKALIGSMVSPLKLLLTQTKENKYRIGLKVGGTLKKPQIRFSRGFRGQAVKNALGNIKKSVSRLFEKLKR